MKKVITAFIVFLIAISIAYLIHEDSGYILIRYGHWEIETSVWLALAIILALYFLVHFLLRLHHHTTTLPDKFSKWQRDKTENQTKRLTIDGLLALAASEWKRAENLFHQAAKKYHNSPLALMGCGLAAHFQNHMNIRDGYFKKALLEYPDAERPITILLARLQLQNHEWNSGLATIKNALETSHSPALFSLAGQAALASKDWPLLQQLLPLLKKQKVLSANEIKNIETEIVKQHVAALKMEGRDDEAAEIIEATLKQYWSADLIVLYSLLQNASAKKLAFAESLLKKHKDSPELYLCLGRLALREKFLGKAKHYFETGMQIGTPEMFYRDMALVYEALGEKETALKFYRLINI
jgi:HemY protein